MVSFPLVDRDSLRSDAVCVTIIRTSKTGKEKILGYYCNVENALVGYLQRKIKESECQSINSLLLSIKSLKQEMTHPKHISLIESELKKEVKG